ncbi:hypothetical protein D7S78_22770 [Ralstonia pickettii]|nr:hypothetical protein [Ralstonia insidiosa]MBA9884408.1 hypothetical protein [Ralstonia pickettii]MBA9894104.1 hypothetical protein [Ralstonia pickettii]MBA9913644.1 hypothetical protein [Ralstonia insidiosa]MBA9926158.1 hypothetical protein [Ralstonia pickettii]
MSTSREEALHALNRACKVRQRSGRYAYGTIVEVHASGDYLKFQKGMDGRLKPQWYRRESVVLLPADPDAEST